MKNSKQEKYLGDIIDQSGKLDETINKRVEKAWAYYSQIKAIIEDLPLGKRKVECGLILREAMLINGVLFNSEAWHGITATHVTRLEMVDHQLLRVITSSHAKVAVEFLYLETGSIPLQFVIKSRRLNYFKNIIDKNENELVKKIYETQKKESTKR